MKQLFLKLVLPAFRWFSSLTRFDRWLAAGTAGTAVTGSAAFVLSAFLMASPAAACDSGGGWYGGGNWNWNWNDNGNWNENFNWNSNSNGNWNSNSNSNTNSNSNGGS